MARGVSSAGRASALQAEGHRFEPCTPHQRKQVGRLAFFFYIEGLEPYGVPPRANARGMLVKNKPSVSLQRTPFGRHKRNRPNSLPTICTNPKCGEISRHGERGEVSADSLTFPFLQGLVSSHPLFLSGEFLVLLFRDKSTKKRLRRGETSHGICSRYAIFYCRLNNRLPSSNTDEGKHKN